MRAAFQSARPQRPGRHRRHAGPARVPEGPLVALAIQLRL